MALSFTLNKVPVAPDLKEACGLPFACVVQPFAPAPAALPAEEVVAASDISRCHECYAYICPQSAFQRTGWVCALCGTLNEFSSVHNQRCVACGAPAACCWRLAHCESAGSRHKKVRFR